MQGRQPLQRELFTTQSLEDLVPDDHLLVRIDKAINLDFIYGLAETIYCSDNGRQSIDPVLFFRMQIISYCYGIKSDRQLCREIHLNIAYRWFCRLNLEDPVPHHSSLTRIRDQFGEETFEAIFSQLIQQWQEVGLVKGKRLIADASLVDANASIDSMAEREDGDPNAKALRAYEQRYHDFVVGKKQRRLSTKRMLVKRTRMLHW